MIVTESSPPRLAPMGRPRVWPRRGIRGMDRPGQRAAVRAWGAVSQTRVFFTIRPVVGDSIAKNRTPPGFFTQWLAVGSLIIGFTPGFRRGGRISAERHDELKAGRDASVDQTDGRNGQC